MNKLTVGIPLIGSSGWLGGVSHMELHVKAVTSLPRNERPNLLLVVQEHSLENFSLYRPFAHLFDGILFYGEEIGRAREKIDRDILHCRTLDELFAFVDFYFPVNYNVLPGRCAASWIHDFQHKYLPDLFPLKERRLRDELCEKIAAESRLVFCSSKAVEADFLRFYPHSPAATRVLALHILPEEAWYQEEPQAVQQHYSLPDRFMLCCNQFWAHKNHITLFKALALLRKQGTAVHLVCTGATGDFRCPDYFKEVQQTIEALGIADLVHILGLIPRQEQIQLLRRCLFVVQPSLFEGLSLIVGECKALGKPIILSDLDVHFEHQYGLYFARSNPEELASHIKALSSCTKPGPDHDREAAAKLEAQGLAHRYAREFCALAAEAQVLFGKSPKTEDGADGREESRRVTLATSLNPSGSLALQQKAVASWQALGFRVLAVNPASEFPLLRPLFPGVEFYEAPQAEKTGIFIAEILECLRAQDCEICGILSPDVYLAGDGFYQAVTREAEDGAVFGSRNDVASLELDKEEAFPRLGYIFFPKKLTAKLPQVSFTLADSGWEVWVLLILLKQGTALRYITSPTAYHVAQSEDQHLKGWLEWGGKMQPYAPSPFPLTEESISRYHSILLHILHKYAVAVTI